MPHENIFEDESFDVHSPSKPQVVTWFTAYAVFMIVLYVAVAAFSLMFFLGDPADFEMDEAGARIVGVILLVVGFAVASAFCLPLIAQPRPWVWTYDIVMICIGMTSACFWPICIPLLIFWVKPETKRYFGSK